MPWSKIFRDRIIDNLRFDEKIRCGKDTLFVLSYLNRITNCRIFDSPSYVFNQDSREIFIKYKQTIPAAVYALSSIYSTYEKLNICYLHFGLNIFLTLKVAVRERSI